MIKFIGSFFLAKNMAYLLLEKISREEMKDYMKELYLYLKEKMPKIDRDPKVFLESDKENAEDLLGKTGFYDPKSEEIHLFITDRHAKDVLRSFAHEVVHHEQNCSGFTATINLSNTHKIDYASTDPKLRKAEKDAFTRGNMFFRDWTDSLKVKREKEKDIMAENVKIDKEKADLNKDNKLSGYEKKRGEAIQKAMSKNKKPVKKVKEQKSCSSKKEVEEAKKKAKEDAKKHIKHQRGKDIEELKEEESLEESKIPYSNLFETKERLLKEVFERKENLVFNTLMERFIKNA
jgi:hypothetical protein